MLTRHQIHVEGKDVENCALNPEKRTLTQSQATHVHSGCELRGEWRGELTARRGREYLPPPPGQLAGYLNLAAVHSLERELSLLLINEGKFFVRKQLIATLAFMLERKIF